MSHLTNRRRFLQAGAGSSIAVLLTGSPSARATEERNGRPGNPNSDSGSQLTAPSIGVAKKFWIDPSIAAWRLGPWRKVHIEYHNSRHMPRLAERFNGDEFADRLLEAHVTGATVFAKDMY